MLELKNFRKFKNTRNSNYSKFFFPSINDRILNEVVSQLNLNNKCQPVNELCARDRYFII